MMRQWFDHLERRLLLATFTPIDGPAFGSALNTAQLGDTIILQAGTTYTGNFILRNKTSGSGWITIQSSNLAQLPAEGVRVKPSDAVNMPRIQSPGGNASAIQTEYGDGVIGAHHFKLIGLEIVGPANNTDLVTLVLLGTTDPIQNTLEEMPHHFVIDRCYMRPNTPSAQVRRAIALNSGSTDITNCYIEEIHQNGSDSQAIGGTNGAGPYNIINNHLEAASENIMFGGSGLYIPNVVPSDIVIRGNYCVKPLSWMGVWAVKNLFELKAGRRILVEGNVFENNWNSAQTGVAILIKLDQYSHSRPWHVTEDITFRNNIVRHAAGGVTIQGRDYNTGSPYGNVRRITFSNNIFDDINGNPWAMGKIGGNFLYMTHGPLDVTFDHNTIINSRTTVGVDQPSYLPTGFVWKDNIAAHNDYGVFGEGASPSTGDSVFNMYFSDAAARFNANVMMDSKNKASLYGASRPASSQYHPSIRAINYWPTTWGAVQFVDQANGNFRLAATSPYRNVGTDGKDLGADVDAIEHASAGAINGIPFAYKVGSIMYVKFGDAQLPILLNTSGSNIVASKHVTSLALGGVSAISVMGSDADDTLQIHAPIAPPMSFVDSGGNDLLQVLSGTQTFAANIGTPSRNLALHVAGGAGAIFNASQFLRSLSVDGNATLSANGNRVVRVTDLQVTGRLDLADNSLIWDYTSGSPIGAWAGSAYNGLTGLIAAGRSAGSWSGNGLVTSRPNALGATPLTTLGIAEAADVLDYAGGATATFAAQTVDTTAVLITYTFAGDADLNRAINGDDYFRIDSGYSSVTRAYAAGDFNLSGKADADDYFLIDVNYNRQTVLS